MKRYWQPIAARIDEMTLRQRTMLFATISLVVVMLAHIALIDGRRFDVVTRGAAARPGMRASASSRVEAGYVDVNVLPVGLQGWKSAGQPTSKIPQS